MNPSWPGTVILQVTLVSYLTLLTQAVSGSVVADRSGTVVTGSTKEVVGKDGGPMLLVPAGDFVMGSDSGNADEKPSHRVYLDAFYMDKFEVTVTRYKLFLESEGYDPPHLWSEAKREGNEQRPVIGVDWYDARAYCRWANKRLPTEAEWEKAARGTDGRIYPWGNETPTRARANFGHETWKGYSTLTKVGSFEDGKSPDGIFDLAGNAWEWVADWYEEHYYERSPERNPKGPSAGPLRVLRGGSWSTKAEVLQSANRAGYPPSAKRSDFGFRCAHDAPK